MTWVTSSTRIPSSARAGPPACPLQKHHSFSIGDHVASFTFNRPATKNAMTWAMYDALVEACDRVDSDHSIRVLMLQRAGDTFASGTDIQQFAQFTSADDGSLTNNGWTP